MRIAMLISSYYPWIGGAEIFAQKVAEHMVQRGHEVDVITGLWDKPDIFTPTWNAKYEAINGVNIYRAKTINIKNIKTLSCMLPIARKAIELDKEKNYDVIHSHIFPAIQSGALVKKLRGKTHLITVQGGDLADYAETTGKFGGVLKPLISWSLKNADLVHAVSTYAEERARELGAKKTVVIPNGVDTKKFRPQNKMKLRKKYHIGASERVIISISRLTEKNGIEYLIRAFAMLKMSNVKLLLLGDGDQRENLKALAKKMHLGKRIEFIGYVPHEKTVEYLNISDVFVRPSLSEGFGIAFIEAMACSVPPIGTQVGGIVDIIEDRKNGLLIPPKNPERLAEAIDLLLTDEQLRLKLGQRGVETVAKKFSWNVVLKKMERIYVGLQKRAR